MPHSKMIILLLFSLLSLNTAFSQSLRADKIEPSCWWNNMKFNKLQLMVYGRDLKNIKAEFDSPQIKVIKIHNAESPDYSFIDIHVPESVKPGDYFLTLSKGSEKTSVKFTINQRRSSAGRFQGFSQKDVIYMITPDRFANGDKSNDSLPGMNDRFSRISNIGRHGGDIQGIIDRLDYLKELGVTALWINPLVENNTRVSYHGYAVTDMYKIDPRFGTNELYVKFVDEAHKRGMKVILDHVNNHIGIYHPWVKNLPFKSWLNGSPEKHHNTIHYNSSNYDVHADSSAWILNNHGWFVDDMPDLNQRDPFLASYLIQNTIWWIELTGLDGIREDTYPYPDQQFLSRWAKQIIDVYPGFNIVGEVWMGDPAFLAPYQKGSPLKKDFDTYLPSVTDFAFNDVVRETFSDSVINLRSLYDLISKDYLYPDPHKLVTFVDNHDITRIVYNVNGDFNRFRMAMAFLLTTRGIPQIYYGTEIGIAGGQDHGSIRAEFPGGFPGSTHNAFLKEGRTAKENEYYDFIKSLLSLRSKYSSAFGSGKLIHFPVGNNLYSYLRIAGNEKVLIILNSNKEKQTFRFSPVGHSQKNLKTVRNVLAGDAVPYTKDLSVEIPPMNFAIYELN